MRKLLSLIFPVPSQKVKECAKSSIIMTYMLMVLFLSSFDSTISFRNTSRRLRPVRVLWRRQRKKSANIFKSQVSSLKRYMLPGAGMHLDTKYVALLTHPLRILTSATQRSGVVVPSADGFSNTTSASATARLWERMHTLSWFINEGIHLINKRLYNNLTLSRERS